VLHCTLNEKPIIVLKRCEFYLFFYSSYKIFNVRIKNLTKILNQINQPPYMLKGTKKISVTYLTLWPRANSSSD